MRAITGISAILVLTAGCAQQADEPAPPACDRECLIGVADAYVAGMAAHDPAGVNFADDFVLVENIEVMDVTQGLWVSASGGSSEFAITIPDEEWQSIGWMGVIENGGEQVMLAIRLKLEDGAITQAEHRYAAPFPDTEENLAIPRTGLTSTVAEAARISHAELIRIGGSYYDALDDNDGTLMPFAPDCARQENGIITAGEGAGQGPASQDIPPLASDCEGQLTSGVMAYITTVADRFVFAADPVTGLAMGFSSLQHPMDFAPYPVTSEDGTVTMFDTERLGYEPWDNAAAHIWKVGGDGLVHEIEAVGFRAASGAATDFERTSVAD